LGSVELRGKYVGSTSDPEGGAGTLLRGVFAPCRTVLPSFARAFLLLLPSVTIAVTVGYHFLVTDLEDTTRIGMRLSGSRYRRLPQLPFFGCTPQKDWTPPGEAQRPGLAEGCHLFCRWGMLKFVVTTVTGVDSSELPVYMRVIRPMIRLPSFGNLW
jgi:hypothetical protein